MKRIAFASLSLLAFCAASPVFAGDIDAASHVDAAILYPDAAIVTRKAEVALPAGDSRLIFHGLPAAVDPASLRVSGAGGEKIEIGAISVQKAPAAAANSPFQTQLKALQAQRDAVQVKIDALAAQQAMMLLYARTAPYKGDGDGKSLDPDEWSKAWDAVGDGLQKTGEALRLAHAAAAAIDDRIKNLKAAQPAPSPWGATQDVAIQVEAAAAGKAEFSLKYRVAGARWTPAYDARLITAGKDGKPKLEIVRRALVSQQTGEDWNNIDLTLATFSATGGTSAPEVRPQPVRFYQPPIVYHGLSGAAPRAKSAPMAAAPVAQSLAREMTPARERRSRIEATRYQAFFHAPGRVSVKADGSAANIRLSSQAPQAQLSWRVSPALDARAFLSAHFVNGEKAPLLPGVVSIYRDGAYVGKGRLKLIAPQEGSDLGFGPDPRVTVLREPVKSKAGDAGLFGRSKVVTRDYRTIFRNLHDFPVHMVVTDRRPYSENAVITVDLLPQTTPPDETSPKGKRGLLVWKFDLAPGKSKEIRLAYRVKWPAGRKVIVP